MELVDGVSLDTVIRSRPDLLSTTRGRGGSSSVRLTEGRASPTTTPPLPDGPSEPTDTEWTRADYRHLAALLAEVADALACAHEHGVIHRDVKPHNLMLGGEQSPAPDGLRIGPADRCAALDDQR